MYKIRISHSIANDYYFYLLSRFLSFVSFFYLERSAVESDGVDGDEAGVKDELGDVVGDGLDVELG